MLKSRDGFTIVELLIVIVVIGILAVIATVGYSGLQKRAQASAVSASLDQVAKKIALYEVNHGSYPASLSAASMEDDSVSLQYSTTETAYCATGTIGEVSLYVSNSQSRPVVGGCPGHGQGGTSAMTNLMLNPSFEVDASRWVANSGATMSRSTAEFLSGSASLRVASTGVTSIYSVSTGIPVGDTKEHMYSAWVKGTGSARLEVGQMPGGTTIATGPIVNLTGEWQRLNLPATAPGSATSVYLRVAQRSSGAHTMYVDSVMVVEGVSLYGYADGSSPNWVWNGPANDSPSTGPAL